jgi:hypothetical protein
MEGGRLRWPEAASEEKKLALSREELALLLDGIGLKQAHRRKWYRKPPAEESEELRIPA